MGGPLAEKYPAPTPPSFSSTKTRQLPKSSQFPDFSWISLKCLPDCPARSTVPLEKGSIPFSRLNRSWQWKFPDPVTLFVVQGLPPDMWSLLAPWLEWGKEVQWSSFVVSTVSSNVQSSWCVKMSKHSSLEMSLVWLNCNSWWGVDEETLSCAVDVFSSLNKAIGAACNTRTGLGFVIFFVCLKRSCSGSTRNRILQPNTILLSGPIQGGLYFNLTKVSSSPALFKVVNILQTSPVRRRCPSCQQIIVLTFFQNEFANLSLELTTSLSAGLKDKRWTAGPAFLVRKHGEFWGNEWQPWWWICPCTNHLTMCST